MRRGQVSLFVILGMVLLLVVALFMFARSSTKDPQIDSNKITHDFSAVKASYEALANRCLTSEAAPLFRQAFSHGGFLDPAAEGFVNFPDFPTRSSAIALGEDYLIPYWFEQESNVGCRGNCRVSFNIPPLRKGEGALPSIEEQVAGELADNVKPCLDAFDAGPDYEVRQGDYLTVDLSIGEGTIDYVLYRDVDYSFLPTGANSSLSMVRGRDATDLVSLYENAIALIDYLVLMNKTDTLPNAVKLIINAYGLTDQELIPPMNGGMSFDAGMPTMWFLPDVKETLQQAFADNLPFVQVSGSKEQRIFLDPNRYSQALYNTGPFKPDVFFPYPEAVPSTTFTLMYLPDWPIDLMISPGSYLIKPEGFSINLPFLPAVGSYSYNFAYDVVVPVLFIIRDESAFNGEGLTLIYAVEVGLAGNEPVLFSDEEVQTNTIDLFSSELMRMGGLTTISVVDALTGDSLPGVELSYFCGSQGSSVGFTNDEGYLETELPFCLGGLVQGSLANYYGESIPLSVIDDEDYAVELSLAPLKNFSLELNAFPLYKYLSYDEVHKDDGEVYDDYVDEVDFLETKGLSSSSGIWKVGTQSGSLLVDDELTLIIKRKLRLGESEQLSVYQLNYSNERGQTVALAPGTYEIEAYLMKDLGEGNQFVIPQRELCIQGECLIMDKVEFNDTLYRGGVSFKEDIALEVTFDNYEDDTLVINYLALSPNDLTVHEDLGVLGEFTGYTRLYNETLLPYFYDSTAPPEEPLPEETPEEEPPVEE